MSVQPHPEFEPHDIDLVLDLRARSFFTPEDIDGSGLTTGTPRAQRLQATLQNTLEQTVLGVLTHLLWAALMPATWLGALPVVVALFISGLTESRIMGFTGLSRLLITYIQLSMAILPIFVLITTVRSLAGDREAGVFEYLLALPVPLGAWYWGKLAGRFLMVFTPVFLAMLGALAWGGLRGAVALALADSADPHGIVPLADKKMVAPSDSRGRPRCRVS